MCYISIIDLSIDDMIKTIQILGLAILGRLWGHKLNIPKPVKIVLIGTLSGALFLPNLHLFLAVGIFIIVGELFRDSIFDLLRGWKWKPAIKMTLRGASFLPLMISINFISNGNITFDLLPWVAVLMLSRPIIQYGCKFLPVAENAQLESGYKQFWKGKAEIYELLWSAARAKCILEVI